MNRKYSTNSVQKLLSGMKLDRRQVCQFLVGGPAALALFADSSSAKEDKIMRKVLNASVAKD